LKKQLELLAKVQQIDTNVKKTELLKIKFEEDAQKLETEVKKDEERHNTELLQLEKFEKEYKDKEKATKIYQEKIVKTEEKMLAIKTNKEYQAAMQEIDNIKKMIGDKEDEMISVMDGIEKVKKELQASEDELNRVKAEFEEKKREVKEDLKEFLDKVEEEKEMRDSYVSEINKDLFDRYKQVQNLRNGVAVAFAEAEHCLSCNMKIPPQLYNEAVRAEKIVACPHCNRILVLKPVKESAEGGA
jgi:predicted  nucleic acid-binding Zn-ribbon protein